MILGTLEVQEYNFEVWLRAFETTMAVLRVGDQKICYY